MAATAATTRAARPARPPALRGVVVGCLLAVYLAKLVDAAPAAAPVPVQSVASAHPDGAESRRTSAGAPTAFRGSAAPATPPGSGPRQRAVGALAEAGAGAGAEAGAGAGAEAGAGPASTRSVDDRAGLAAPRPEPALVDEHQLAAAGHLGHQPALDAALALLRHAERDAALGLDARLHALGVEVKDVFLDPSKIATLAAPLTAELTTALASSPTSEAAQRRASLIQAILAALQALEKPGGVGAAAGAGAGPAQPLQPPQLPTPDANHTQAAQLASLAQVTPHKKPVFSDSYLPALVQVLSHLVDLVEESEQAAAATAAAAAAAATPEPPATPTAVPDTDAPESTPPPTSTELGPATETIELTVVESPSSSDQIVIQGPLQGIVGLLQTVTANIHGPTSPAHVVISETAPGDAGRKNDSKAVNEVVDNEVAKNVAPQSVLKEVVMQGVSGMGLEREAEAVKPEEDSGDDDENDNMPVVQSDVPIVNEETVPMMMMINMVPSDAPEMVMDSAADDDVEVAVTTLTPSGGNLFKAGASHVLDTPRVDADADLGYTPEEIRNFVSHPAIRRDFQADGSSTLEDILESADFEDLKDNAFLVNGIRGEAASVGKAGKAQKRAPPSVPLLKLVRLRFALSAEAKRQNFKNIQGFSDAVLANLAKTSDMTSREQLGALLTTVQDRDEIKSAKTRANASKVLEELQSEDSPLSEKLKNIPALKYTP